MNKYLLPKLIALIVCCFLNNAQAALITTELPNGLAIYTTPLDSLFDAKIMIDAVPDLGSIDFTLAYDNSKLNALSIDSDFIFGQANTYTPSGTPAWTGGTIHFAEAIDGSSPLTAGINVTVPTLLATIHFKAIGIAAGVNNVINPTSLILSDFDGNPLDGSFQQAFVTVTQSQPPAPIPAPPMVWLFGSALAGWGFFGKRRKGS